MLLFPLSLILGLLAGTFAGGSVKSLTSVRLRLPGIVVAALAMQLLLTTSAMAGLSSGVRVVLLGVSYAAAGAWLAVNIPRRPMSLAVGLAVTGLGWLLNMCVVLANAGMPVSTSALVRVGAGTTLLHGGGPFGKHVQMGAGAALSFLGDTIPVVPFGTVISVGDLVMIVGLVVAVAAAMRAPRPVAPAGALA